MNKRTLESYTPKIKKGMIQPSGRNFLYEIEGGHRVELPFAMADVVLLCDGHHTLYQVLTKIHERQGVVHFQKVIETVLLLTERNFFENASEIRGMARRLKMILGISLDLRGRLMNFISDWSRVHVKREMYIRENIKERVESNSFFSEMTEEALDHVLNSCEVIVYSRGQYVIHKDEEPKDIFFLLEGRCEAIGDSFVGAIQRGSFFGEGALRPAAARAASVRATKASQVLRIPVDVIKQVVASPTHIESLRRQIIVSQFFGSSHHFQGVREETIEKLHSAGQLEVVDSETVVFEDGEPSTGLYFLVRGSVRAEVSEEKVVVLSQGEIFGEVSVMAKLPRTARVITREPCFLFKVSHEAFWEILLSDLDFAYRVECLSASRLADDFEILQKKSLKVG